MLSKILFIILETTLISLNIKSSTSRIFDLFIDGALSNVFYYYYIPVNLSTVVISSLWYIAVMIYQSTHYPSVNVTTTAATVPPQQQKIFEWSYFDFIIFSLITAGALLRILCYRIITKEPNERRDNKVIASGPYAYVQHPLYTGYVMIMLGRWYLFWVLHDWSPPQTVKYFWIFFGIDIWFLVFGLYNRAVKEEQVLAKRFGKQWNEYAKNKKRFIPYIF